MQVPFCRWFRLVRVLMPQNVPGWEPVYSYCKRAGIPFRLVAAVGVGDLLWRVDEKQD